MASIKKINESIASLNEIVDSYSITLKNEPNNFAVESAIESIEKQIEELQQQLRKENTKRFKEVIELRFKGAEAKNGTLPLSIVGELTNPLSKAIFQTSKYRQFGKKGGKKIEAVVNNTIDLRLEDISVGSTIFYLSAKTSPDLFGNSLIQTSFENIFELLNSQTADEIVDNIPAVGANSIKYYSDFFKELNSNKLDIDITWYSPNEEIKIWNGTQPKILSLYNTLNKVKFNEPEEVNFKGEIIMLSKKGKFEILTEDKERFFGTFPAELLPAIQHSHIGDLCTGILLKTTIYNPATKKEKYEYSLSEINVQ